MSKKIIEYPNFVQFPVENDSKHLADEIDGRFLLTATFKDRCCAENNDLYIMLNPSKADGNQSDNTINRILRFSYEKSDVRSVTIINLFPVYTPDSRKLRELLDALNNHKDLYEETMKHNDKVIKKEIKNATRIIFAWGDKPSSMLVKPYKIAISKVYSGVNRSGKQDVVHVIKSTMLTGNDQPKHPSRIGIEDIVPYILFDKQNRKTDITSNGLVEQAIKIFERSNERFLSEQTDFILSNVSERSMCGQLMRYLTNEISETPFRSYHVDIEYNRNDGKIKTIKNHELKIISITCDIIVHSRGQNIEQDNLIAIEMKKSTQPQSEKTKDKERLIALTKESFDDIWSYDGETFPEHVCRYSLGVYYEIDIESRIIAVEYYNKGEFDRGYSWKF